MIELLPPGLILIAGALLTPALPARLRNPWLVLLPVLSMIQFWNLPLGFELNVEFFDYTLELVRVDRLSRVFGTVFHIAAFLSAIYAYRESDRDQQVAASVYAGSAIAGVFAGLASATPSTMYESWLTVEYASRAFRLSLVSAISDAIKMVADATHGSQVEPATVSVSRPKM